MKGRLKWRAALGGVALCAALASSGEASAQEMFVYRDAILPDFDVGVQRAQRFLMGETRSLNNLRVYVTYEDGAVYMHTNFLTPGHSFTSKVVSTAGGVSVREMLAWAVLEDPATATHDQLDAVARAYCKDATVYFDSTYLAEATRLDWPVYPARGMGVVDPNNYPRGAARAPYDDLWYVRSYYGVWVRPDDAGMVGQMKTLALRRLREAGHQWFAAPGRAGDTGASSYGDLGELSAQIDGGSSQLAVVLAPLDGEAEQAAMKLADDNGVSLLWVDLEEVESREEEPLDPCLPSPEAFDELEDDEGWEEEWVDEPIDGARVATQALAEARNHEQVLGMLARPLMSRGYVMVLEESTHRSTTSFTFGIYPAVDVERGEPVGRVFFRVNEDAYGRLLKAEAPPEPEAVPDEVEEEEPESRHFWLLVLMPLGLVLGGVGFFALKKRRDDEFQRRMKEMD